MVAAVLSAASDVVNFVEINYTRGDVEPRSHNEDVIHHSCNTRVHVDIPRRRLLPTQLDDGRNDGRGRALVRTVRTFPRKRR